MDKRYLVTVRNFGFGNHSNSIAKVLSIFSTREEAAKFVETDMEKWLERNKDEGVEINKNKLVGTFDYDATNGYKWEIVEDDMQGKYIPTALYKKCCDLTDNNYHSECLVEVAKWAADNCRPVTHGHFFTLMKQLEDIMMIHNRDGHLEYELGQVRYLLMDMLLAAIGNEFGSLVEYTARGCF